MDKNKIIAEWLGWCWPEWESMSDDGICIVCGEISESHTKHDFTTWQGFGLLIEALKERKMKVTVTTDNEKAVAVIRRPEDLPFVERHIVQNGETIPDALVNATIQLIEKTND